MENRVRLLPDEDSTFTTVDIDLYKVTDEACKFLFVSFVLPTNDGRWYASSMELGMN